MRLPHVERRCGHKWTESAEHACGMYTVVEMEGATDTFATMCEVKMSNFFGHADIILQCDPGPSLIK